MKSSWKTLKPAQEPLLRIPEPQAGFSQGEGGPSCTISKTDAQFSTSMLPPSVVCWPDLTGQHPASPFHRTLSLHRFSKHAISHHLMSQKPAEAVTVWTCTKAAESLILLFLQRSGCIVTIPYSSNLHNLISRLALKLVCLFELIKY